jgi:hypothetical protein
VVASPGARTEEEAAEEEAEEEAAEEEAAEEVEAEMVPAAAVRREVQVGPVVVEEEMVQVAAVRREVRAGQVEAVVAEAMENRTLTPLPVYISTSRQLESFWLRRRPTKSMSFKPDRSDISRARRSLSTQPSAPM